MNFSRGRGRGRGSNNQNQNNAVQSPWSSTTKTLASTGTVRPGHKKENLENKNRMIDMQSRYGKILDDMEASDSSDEEIHNEQIISKLTKNFDSSLDGVEEIHQSQMVQDILQTGAICCLVCIETVKRLNAIWSCTKCFSIFHLQCIQKWAREGIGRQAIQAEGDLRDVKFMWNCPKCRHEYSQNENPTKYMCYCGKEEDPPFDPWIVPHSCGNKCERLLQPECGHECLLLCHPGACPPCPKTIKSKCYCGKSSPVLKRCSQKFWSCGNVCGQKLPCGQHVCEQVCHSGECPPCPKTSEKKCMCGKKKAIRKCAENVWSCQQACNKALSCDHHVCEKECHSEDCGDCPRGGNRFCPCGKTEIQLPCTEDVNTCVDTCMKPLNCQLHKCSKKCHFGSCESCLQVVEKSCRCGKKKKLVPCSQPLSCESKCTKTRSCGRHPCKKKCCNGSCPPCEQVCNRNLNCRNHKCPSPCHQGLCYPCPESKKVTCFCGSNSITTPCGKEKSVKPPRCKKQCTIPSDCHHEKRENHRCHFGRCPPCKKACGKLFECGHSCLDLCHDQVRDKDAENRNLLRGINGKRGNKEIYVALPCQPCRAPVKKSCLGEHDFREFPCSEVVEYACQTPCGRRLACGNHTCTKKCHLVKGKPEQGKAGSNCEKCKETCRKERPAGCVHDCKLPCHPGDCPPCETHLKMFCHCKALQVYLKCWEFHEADEKRQEEMLCCTVRCQRIISCGHACSKICHKGPCSLANECQEKKKVKCKCGRKKKDLPCIEVDEDTQMDCDDKCKEIKAKKNMSKQQEEKERRDAELRAQQEELEKFERKKQGRKRKAKQEVVDVKTEEGFFKLYGKWIGISILLIVFIAFCVQISMAA